MLERFAGALHHHFAEILFYDVALICFQDLRITATVAVVIGLFVICWTPFFGINFAFSFCISTKWKSVRCAELSKMPMWIFMVTKWLQYGNSVCNPIIYGLRNKEFRRAFRKILLGLCCKKVRLSDYRKSPYELPNLKQDLHNRVPLGLTSTDKQDDCKGIQSAHDKPMTLEFLERSLPDDLLAPSADVFHTPHSAIYSSGYPVALCNLAFEGPVSIGQADAETRTNENASES